MDDFSRSTNASYKARNDSEFFMTLNGFQPFSTYCVQVKALGQTAESPFSECVIVAPRDGKITITKSGYIVWSVEIENAHPSFRNKFFSNTNFLFVYFLGSVYFLFLNYTQGHYYFSVSIGQKCDIGISNEWLLEEIPSDSGFESLVS